MNGSDSAARGEIVLYQAPDGTVELEVRLQQESLWLSQRQMSQLFDKDPDTIGLHLRNIFKEGELAEAATTEESSVVQEEGGRKVRRKIQFYNLDAIISVGYRVNSKRGTQFRISARLGSENQEVRTASRPSLPANGSLRPETANIGLPEKLQHPADCPSEGQMRVLPPTGDPAHSPAHSSSFASSFLKAARTIRQHPQGILNAVVLKCSNAGAESINAKIQKVKGMACGYRNRERFRNAIYLHLGGLDLYPESLRISHTNS